MSVNSGQKGNTEQEAEIGKDSLKVKIKLNKNSINKTDSSMEDISPIVDQPMTEKPLKIKIRKNDLISSSPSVNNAVESSNAKVLSLATFPKLDPVSFPQLQRVTGVTPEQFTDWSDRDVNLLKEELENIKRSIKDFTTSLQSQLDILEIAKDKKESLICKPPPSTPLSNSNLLSNSSSNLLNSPISTSVASPIIKKDPLTITPTPTPTPSSQVKSEPKRRYRKRKKHGEGSSDEDEQFEEREDSEIEDEIDVVNDIDIEDAEYIDAPLDNENKSGPRQGKIIRKRNMQGRNKKNVGKNRQNKSSSYNKKNKFSTSSSQPKSDDNDSDELELTQLPRPPGKVPPKHNFWIDMEPYFTPFTEEDLKLLTQQTLDPEDSAFVIPPLGKPRADSILLQQQQSNAANISEESILDETSSITTVKSESKVEEDKGLHCGDLTSRVLAALIEEKIVPNSTSIPTLTSNSNSFSLKPSKENSLEDSSTSDTSCIPITTPPVYDFSQTSVVNLEERIKIELKAIGLLEEDINIDSNNREDDEICSELRLLQHQLREHVNISNKIRAKLYDAVKNAIEVQEKERKERIVEEALEQQYVKSQVITLVTIYNLSNGNYQKKKKRKSTSVT